MKIRLLLSAGLSPYSLYLIFEITAYYWGMMMPWTPLREIIFLLAITSNNKTLECKLKSLILKSTYYSIIKSIF